MVCAARSPDVAHSHQLSMHLPSLPALQAPWLSHPLALCVLTFSLLSCCTFLLHPSHNQPLAHRRSMAQISMSWTASSARASAAPSAASTGVFDHVWLCGWLGLRRALCCVGGGECIVHLVAWIEWLPSQNKPPTCCLTKCTPCAAAASCLCHHNLPPKQQQEGPDGQGK